MILAHFEQGHSVSAKQSKSTEVANANFVRYSLQICEWIYAYNYIHPGNIFSSFSKNTTLNVMDVPLVEFMYLVYTCMPGESYCRSLLLYLPTFWMPDNNPVWHSTSLNGLKLYLHRVFWDVVSSWLVPLPRLSRKVSQVRHPLIKYQY